MLSVMNNTKWEELCSEMYELKASSPQWRTKDLTTGYLSPWDGDWFYHFREGGFDSIEWVELKIDSTAQYEIVLGILKQINLPGSKSESGFKIYGYVPMSQYVECI